MEINKIAAIQEGRTALGIELGSTRIKAVLVGPNCLPLASGAHNWENRLEEGLWTYRLEDVWTGIQDAYRGLAQEVLDTYGLPLEKVGAIGISAMMHGYLPLDAQGNQLCPFRTWRNTVTGQESQELTQLLGFNIPQRWSAAHLYRAVRNGEAHISQLAYLTTLAGYVHWRLTGEKVVGVGEAAGMFPIDSDTCDYHKAMAQLFDQRMAEYHVPWKMADIFPKVLPAGEIAGHLTPEGAKLLDPAGRLQPGIPLCPPEGDAGTGMTATNSVAPRTGNVSAGTSIFAMVVLEKPLSRVYPEIDMVTTPTGRPVAMVHCNTCTSDLDAWVQVFGQLLEAAGSPMEKSALYDLLYNMALTGDPDCGGIVSYNAYSGEPVLGLEEGRPMLIRQPQLPFTLANLMRAQLSAAMAPLKIGMDLLLEQEHAALDRLYGHGGLFKTKGVGQQLMAGALQVPVSVMETAGEGGPWGMAILAMYMENRQPGQSLEDYLESQVFAGAQGSCAQPDPADSAGFASFVRRYKEALPAQRAAASADLC